MASAEVFVAETEFKNQESFRGLVASSYLPALAADKASIAEMLRMEAKLTIEAIEAAAIWIADSESLEMKILLGSQCGVHARQYGRLQDRLATLGLAPGSYDPREGGYSKLFAFLRSLQTSEERAAAGLLTVGGAAVARLDALLTVCRERGDEATATLLSSEMIPDEQRRADAGRDRLVLLATAEDSQARARRAVFKTIELLGDVCDPGVLRRMLGRTGRR
ncbi:MAG: hypothetical protein JXP73_20770 [Deltaproteobacteria bacterium]|nr:hypothetical protein [Deltaproteobacteria bacterium]